MSRSSRRRRLMWLVLGVAALTIVAAAGWWVMVGPGKPGGPAGSVILQLSGDSDAHSTTFYARSGWQIQWENTGAHFSYTIRGDVDFGQVINQNGPGNGITSPVPTGNFYIVVAAQGPWSIKVTQGD